MSRPSFGFVSLTVYAIAMGLVEAACVVSLKALYAPTGFRLPFHALPVAAIAIEQWREVATLAMIAAVAALGSPGWRLFVSRGLWIFGIWDLGYYAFLTAWTGFPARLTDLDVVFLVPRPWVAPVWVPVACSAACLLAALALRPRGGRQNHQDRSTGDR
jgi:hypothetical protein